MARVLVAEANERIRYFIAGILSDCGHIVAACADRVEADTLLASVAVDVVVTDLVLQSREGQHFGRNCATLGVPTITLSGREFRADQAGEEPPAALLEKPFRFSDLQRVLDAVAARSRSAPSLRRDTASAA